MTEHRVNMGMPYYQAYRLYRGRRDLGVGLSENAPIVVREIDASEAPVAYRIHTEDDYVSDRLQDVRSFESTFWWPLMTHDGPVSVDRFVEFAAKGTIGAFLAFDEPPRMGKRDGRLSKISNVRIRCTATASATGIVKSWRPRKEPGGSCSATATST